MKTTPHEQTDAVRSSIRDLKQKISDAISKGESFTPTPEETELYNLPLEVKTLSDQSPKHFQLAVKKYDWQSPPAEVKTRGWINFKDHPSVGLLGKPCPVCDYKYGHAWVTEAVPQDILQWLLELPESPVTSPWV